MKRLRIHTRVLASSVLLCWMWFSIAASFAHTCNDFDSAQPGYSSGIACAACLWATFVRPGVAPAAPTVVILWRAAPVWTPPQPELVFVAPPRIASRAPPRFS